MNKNKDKQQTGKAEGEQKQKFGVLFSLLTPMFRRHKYRLIIGFAALLSVDFLQLTIPRIIKWVVDGLADNTIVESTLLQLGLLIVGMAVLIGVLRFIWRTFILGFSRLLERYIRDQIFEHLVEMDQPFYEKRTPGQIMAHMSNDLTSVQMACGMGMVAAVDALVMSVAAVGFMLFIDAKLTLLALLPMPILAVCTRVLASRLHKKFTTVQEQFGLLTEFTRSTLVSIRLIKAYTMEHFQSGEFDKLGRTYVKSNLKVATIQGLLYPVATLVGSSGMLLVIYFGGKLVIEESISLGDFVAFITYLYMLVWPMMAVGWVANLVQRGLTSLNRVYLLLNSQPLLIQKGGEDVPLTAPFRFRFVKFNFSYPNTDQRVLNDISLDIGQGILGITGHTGSGKSSLCKILARIYPVRDGALFLGDLDINTLCPEQVREQIAYVGQEPVLFSTTIRENISFSRPDAPMELVEKSAKLAGVHGDIMAFAEGYDSVIGERGVTLSGGQRQRVTLARALLCNRPILLIDDGLSAVDVETEHAVIQGLREELHNKTVVIVSHRIKLLSLTDQIIILDQGEIIHQGGHEQLLESSAFYRLMYEKQSGADRGGKR